MSTRFFSRHLNALWWKRESMREDETRRQWLRIRHERACLQGESYHCARVTLESRLKIARVYKQISQIGLPDDPDQLNQLYWCVSTCVRFFVTSMIWNQTWSSPWKTCLNSWKKGKYYHHNTENTLYCSDVYNNISFRNWIMPFKLSRLLVTHDGGKLSRVGELSLAECLQGR